MRVRNVSMLAAAVAAVGLAGWANAAPVSAAQVVNDILHGTYQGAQVTPLVGSYSGEIVIKYVNFDVGRLYDTGASGTFGTSGTPLPNGALASTDPTGTLQADAGGGFTEDSWGIMLATEIWNASQTTRLWTSVLSPYEITGMFWGETDTVVDFATQPGHQLIHGVNMKFALYSDTSMDFNAAIGPTGRVGVADFRTATDVNAAGLADPDASILWSMNSVGGADLNFPLDHFFTNFNPAAGPGTPNVGDGKVNFDFGNTAAGTGGANSFFDLPTSPDVTVRFTGIDPVFPVDAWTVQSNDPMVMTTIPTPAAAWGGVLLAGMVTLNVYRRRKSAE